MLSENKYKYLGQIRYPSDLRSLPIESLPEVCKELRSKIIEEVAVNPGHLASSLGATEITIACHYVFNTPDDRIVWDVGHQAYGHKIITGRGDIFYTNRKLHGLMPFPSPKESEYDTFTCGHASNSISAALGMAVAAKLQNKKRHVVAIIGDGAMSGGLAYEGLNNVSSQPNDLLIILNDNEMSIDRAVGGMEQYLIGLNTNETYNKIRNRASIWFEKKGLLTEERKKGIIRLTNSLKSVLARQQNIFEGMNIRYFGPFDGNNVSELVRILRQLKDMKGPKLLHLRTVKGKGYEPAEKSATVWHAPGKFDPATGERVEQVSSKVNPPKYQYVFGKTLLELARQNNAIVGVTPAMPTGCSMNIVMDEIPERCFDVGIAEGHAVTFSAGMAKDGLIPFCNIYSSFLQRAYDNIIHDAAILNLPVVLCLDRAGLVGEDGATHHGAFDLAFLRPIPNLTISAPMNEHELRKLMYTAQLPDKGTFVIRYPRGNGVLNDWECPLEEITVGKGRKIREGNKLAVLSIGTVGNDVERAIDAIELEKKFNKTSLIAHYDMRFLKPLDEAILQYVGQTFSYVITVEDGVRAGGLGTAISEWMSDHGFTPHIVRLGLPDTFVEQGTVEELKHICGIDICGIKKEIINGLETVLQ
ncbi:1-deoxy-D-xylulose-5-phosphate synthase [Prevotella amnii]|uniref:1-deoxy-D-xylulose-5-phosphate synthase n=1 Tax=Prevotella amnii DNF00058 TaxID=1401066 RepID=A0A096AZ93_9BACT|nr:1-deoxy-D-xylulose-5-phosphate synthase [Prevotella amnii]KGF52066.1 1-deoxy-D-xylulose-5-phosphate synthase [Prevotella amnii DNF00058]